MRHGATPARSALRRRRSGSRGPAPGCSKPSVTPTSSFCRPAIRWSPSASSWASPASGMHCAGPAPRSSASRRSSTANPSAATPMPVWPRSVCRRRPWRWPASTRTSSMPGSLIRPMQAFACPARASRFTRPPAHARRGVRRGHRRRSARARHRPQAMRVCRGAGLCGAGTGDDGTTGGHALLGWPEVTEGADLASPAGADSGRDAHTDRDRAVEQGPLEVLGVARPSGRQGRRDRGRDHSGRGGAGNGGRVTCIVAAAGRSGDGGSRGRCLQRGG